MPESSGGKHRRKTLHEISLANDIFNMTPGHTGNKSKIRQMEVQEMIKCHLAKGKAAWTENPYTGRI